MKEFVDYIDLLISLDILNSYKITDPIRTFYVRNFSINNCFVPKARAIQNSFREKICNGKIPIRIENTIEVIRWKNDF
jgi:hypothetical protein